jgi:uncharacterized repeat protein (TIGR04052 family)
MFQAILKPIAVRALPVLIVACACVPSLSAQQPIEVRFKALVGEQPLACGKEYDAIGLSKSRITPKDFRFYIRDLRVVDDKGVQIPVDLEQDGKWQLDRIALLDFEDRTGSCAQGTPDLNDKVKGTVPSGTVVSGIRFRLGIPPERNHAPSIYNAPAPLSLSAMIWSWATGYLFMRADYETAAGRSSPIHIGDVQDNLPWPDVEFMGFDLSKDAIAADLAVLLKPLDPLGRGGCMHNCPGLLPSLFADGNGQQTLFRKVTVSETK